MKRRQTVSRFQNLHHQPNKLLIYESVRGLNIVNPYRKFKVYPPFANTKWTNACEHLD